MKKGKLYKRKSAKEKHLSRKTILIKATSCYPEKAVNSHNISLSI